MFTAPDLIDIEKEILNFIRPIRSAWKQRKIDAQPQYVKLLESKFPNIPRIQQIYMLENGLTEKPTCQCQQCDNEVGFRFDKGFAETCSKKCMGILSKTSGRSQEWQKKVKQTTLNRYGVENAFQSEELKLKIKQTNIERYGVEHPMHRDEVKEKIKQTNIQRYGNPEGIINSPEVKKILSDRSFVRMQDFTLNTIQVLSQIDRVDDVIEIYPTAHPDIEFICKICDTITIANYMTICNRIKEFGTPCPKCSGVVDRGSSGGQRMIAEFVRGQGFEVLENNRIIIAPKHLDIVIPNIKLAIEYNGLFFHSEKRRKDRMYHLNKLGDTIEAGYRLITIFEDEWIYKQHIVKEKLLYILGISKKIIFARKCHIQSISVQDARNFINQYHLQGYTGCRYRYGLFYGNEMVAVMTFSLPSIAKGATNKISGIELNRYCSNGSIVGGAGKLLSFFCRQHTEYHNIFSFADKRWSEGSLYKKLGFVFVHSTPPNYWYSKGNQRIHRFALRKCSTDIAELSESQNRTLQGYSKIWDCGSLKYSYTNPFS